MSEYHWSAQNDRPRGAGEGGGMTDWKFVVSGPPVAKQRPRRGANGAWYTPTKTKDYERQVALEAMAAGVKLDPGKTYGVRIVFFLSSWRRDIDNLAKSVLDGLQQLGWNDNTVRHLDIVTHAVKDGSEEMAVVELMER